MAQGALRIRVERLAGRYEVLRDRLGVRLAQRAQFCAYRTVEQGDVNVFGNRGQTAVASSRSAPPLRTPTVVRGPARRGTGIGRTWPFCTLGPGRTHAGLDAGVLLAAPTRLAVPARLRRAAVTPASLLRAAATGPARRRGAGPAVIPSTGAVPWS
jgi:hypothetical protein